MKITNENKARKNILLILLSSHILNVLNTAPKINKTIPLILMILTLSNDPRCIKKMPAEIKPIVEINRHDLKSLIADSLSSALIFQYALLIMNIGVPHIRMNVTSESVSIFNHRPSRSGIVEMQDSQMNFPSFFTYAF